MKLSVFLPARYGYTFGAVYCVVACISSPLMAQPSEPVSIQTHLQAGINLVREDNLFWDLAEKFAPDVDYAANTGWLELYLKPGLSFDSKRGFYGKSSLVMSSTSGTDAYDTGDTGRITLEEAYLGYRFGNEGERQWDISLGAREFKLGSGMLISNGATSGFERGALKLGPRKAWERTAIIKSQGDELTATLFYLDPNELDSNNTDTRLYGFDINTTFGDMKNPLGLTFGHVLRSGSPYAKAPEDGMGPPGIIQNGRDNLSFVNHYGSATLHKDTSSKVFMQWDAAYQWNDDIDLNAWGGRIKIGKSWLKKDMQPTLSYSWQSFSGDDPFTDKLERFDPLYYEGSPSAWSTGSKSSMVFINSNVQSHQLTLTLNPSPQHIVNLRVAHIRVNELNSPVQFGQASRLDFSDGLSTVITGVSDAHLADDFFIEYTYLMSQSLFLTLGLSLSVPGDGINKALGETGPDWSGGFANFVLYL